jgi:hypothetical protein
MSSIVYTTFKGRLFDSPASIDLANDTFRVILLSAAYPSVAASAEQSHVGYSDVSAYEIVGATGYTISAGQLMTGLSAYTNIGTNQARWTANNVIWTTSTITAAYATIVDSSRPTAGNGGQLVCTIDFGGNKSSSNGDFTIQWNANGILNLTD